jgi:hypothetical protein
MKRPKTYQKKKIYYLQVKKAKTVTNIFKRPNELSLMKETTIRDVIHQFML